MLLYMYAHAWSSQFAASSVAVAGRCFVITRNPQTTLTAQIRGQLSHGVIPFSKTLRYAVKHVDSVILNLHVHVYDQKLLESTSFY